MREEKRKQSLDQDLSSSEEEQKQQETQKKDEKITKAKPIHKDKRISNSRSSHDISQLQGKQFSFDQRVIQQRNQSNQIIKFVPSNSSKLDSNLQGIPQLVAQQQKSDSSEGSIRSFSELNQLQQNQNNQGQNHRNQQDINNRLYDDSTDYQLHFYRVQVQNQNQLIPNLGIKDQQMVSTITKLDHQLINLKQCAKSIGQRQYDRPAQYLVPRQNHSQQKIEPNLDNDLIKNIGKSEPFIHHQKSNNESRIRNNIIFKSHSIDNNRSGSAMSRQLLHSINMKIRDNSFQQSQNSNQDIGQSSFDIKKQSVKNKQKSENNYQLNAAAENENKINLSSFEHMSFYDYININRNKNNTRENNHISSKLNDNKETLIDKKIIEEQELRIKELQKLNQIQRNHSKSLQLQKAVLYQLLKEMQQKNDLKLRKNKKVTQQNKKIRQQQDRNRIIDQSIIIYKTKQKFNLSLVKQNKKRSQSVPQKSQHVSISKNKRSEHRKWNFSISQHERRSNQKSQISSCRNQTSSHLSIHRQMGSYEDEKGEMQKRKVNELNQSQREELNQKRLERINLTENYQCQREGFCQHEDETHSMKNNLIQRKSSIMHRASHNQDQFLRRSFSDPFIHKHRNLDPHLINEENNETRVILDSASSQMNAQGLQQEEQPISMHRIEPRNRREQQPQFINEFRCGWFRLC